MPGKFCRFVSNSAKVNGNFIQQNVCRKNLVIYKTALKLSYISFYQK